MKNSKIGSFKIRALCVVLAICVIAGGAACVTAGAAETGVTASTAYIDPYTYDSGAANFSDELCSYVESQFRAYKSRIDIEKYNITADNVKPLFLKVLFENPDIFYIDPSTLPYYIDQYTGIVTEMAPSYIYDKAKIPAMTKEFEAAAERLVAGVDLSWSQADKALAIHDDIALSCVYASNEVISSGTKEIFTSYGCLVNQIAVCQGYALAYNYLLSKVGINAELVNSDSMNHAWSMVEVDGQYYHVDITWDDPLYDKLGQVHHDNFLRSDDAMRDENKHTGWTSEHTASSTYDGYFWSDVNTKLYLIDGDYYFISNLSGSKLQGNLVKYSQGQKTSVLQINERWAANEEKTSFWANNFAFLTMSEGKFYYNTSDKIYSVNIDGSDNRQVYALSASQSAIGNIYGFVQRSDGFYISLANEPNCVMNNQKITLTEEVPTTEPPTTEPPTTEPPTTEPPTTEPPTTEPPTTEPPTTEPPTTEPPTTEPPTTEPPTTEPSTTEPPTTEPPTTEPPTTEPPTTEPPTTEPPTTEPPATEPSTTEPVQPTETVLTDEDTGISVVTDTEAELAVEALTSREDVEAVYAVLGDTDKLIKVYDISLVKDGVAVQPDSAVTVKIPASSESAKVYRLEADGTLTDMNAVFADGYLEFTTEDISVYAVVEDEPEKLMGDVNGDGKYDIRDAAAIQLYKARLYIGEFDESVADVNGDGVIDVRDAAYIQLDLAKLL